MECGSKAPALHNSLFEDKKGGHTGRPFSNRQESSACLGATSFLRQASRPVGEQAPVPAAPEFAKYPTCHP